MKTIGIGIIGWGFMGRTHAHALRSIPLFYPGIDFEPRLVGVASRTAEGAGEAARLLGLSFATRDFRALLARPDIDAVSVCTPNDLHEEMVVAALHAGKHVYVDKPLAADLEAAARMREAAREARGQGVFSQMVLNNRFSPAIMRAKELMGEGRIGDLLSFSCRYLHSGSVDPERPAGWKQGPAGGVLLDLGSHALDLLAWLIGWPRRVLCATRTLYPERPARGGGTTRALSEDQALATLEMPCGALGTVEASKIATGASDELLLEIRGTRGALSWNLMEPNWLCFYDGARPEVPLGGERGLTRIECVGRYPAPGGAFLPAKNAIGWDRAHIHCYYSFLASLARGQAPSPSIEDGYQLQRLMDALARSSSEGRWIEFERDGRADA